MTTSRMSQHPDYTKTVSLKLSEALDDIGVNERMVQKRRRMLLLTETMMNSISRLYGMDISTYCFGSRSEGSTTLRLNSDSDTLFYRNSFNVIQDCSEWQPGKENLLMIRDETTSPGYCLLQILRNDEPLPLSTAFLEHLPDRHLTVRGGKVLLKNTVFRNHPFVAGSVRNGPAESRQGRQNLADQDYVPALPCKSWPVEARPWLVGRGIGRWPTEDMKRYCETTGCFLVAVSSKSGHNEELEWRISTSQAERHLMFSLTITQLRCYILLKMILKTFINPQCDGVLSSFMCKTVLFHCIQNTHSNYWQSPNLLACLICCLVELQKYVRQKTCKHFIIPENNLMAGKISSQNEDKILEILQNVIQSQGSELLKISIDDLGARLQRKMNMDETFQYYRTPAQICALISTELLVNTADQVSKTNLFILQKIMHEGNEMAHERLSHIVTRSYREMGCNSHEKLFKPLLCTSLGSVIASHDIETTSNIKKKKLSPEALNWFSAGLNSDVSSGRLKKASALYRIGDIEQAEFALRKTEETYDLSSIEPICACYDKGFTHVRQGFMDKCNTGNEELIKHIIAFCVRFLRCEINCVPVELQYEMFRSAGTQDGILERDEFDDYWMDMAVVDSLPYLYFLQYKTYGALQRAADQQHALANLITTIDTEINLSHRETALNLLGQCLAQEIRYTDALHCYTMSLNIRGRNNAASVLICILLNVLVNMQTKLLRTVLK